MQIDRIPEWHLSAADDAAAGCRTVSNRIAHVEIKANRAVRIVSDGDDSLMVLPLTDDSWPDDALLDLRGPMF